MSKFNHQNKVMNQKLFKTDDDSRLQKDDSARVAKGRGKLNEFMHNKENSEKWGGAYSQMRTGGATRDPRLRKQPLFTASYNTNDEAHYSSFLDKFDVSKRNIPTNGHFIEKHNAYNSKERSKSKGKRAMADLKRKPTVVTYSEDEEEEDNPKNVIKKKRSLFYDSLASKSAKYLIENASPAQKDPPNIFANNKNFAAASTSNYSSGNLLDKFKLKIDDPRNNLRRMSRENSQEDRHRSRDYNKNSYENYHDDKMREREQHREEPRQHHHRDPRMRSRDRRSRDPHKASKGSLHHRFKEPPTSEDQFQAERSDTIDESLQTSYERNYYQNELRNNHAHRHQKQRRGKSRQQLHHSRERKREEGRRDQHKHPRYDQRRDSREFSALDHHYTRSTDYQDTETSDNLDLQYPDLNTFNTRQQTSDPRAEDTPEKGVHENSDWQEADHSIVTSEVDQPTDLESEAPPQRHHQHIQRRRQESRNKYKDLKPAQQSKQERKTKNKRPAYEPPSVSDKNDIRSQIRNLNMEQRDMEPEKNQESQVAESQQQSNHQASEVQSEQQQTSKGDITAMLVKQIEVERAETKEKNLNELCRRFIVSLEVQRLTKVLRNLDQAIEKKDMKVHSLEQKAVQLQTMVDKFVKETPILEKNYTTLKNHFKNLGHQNEELGVKLKEMTHRYHLLETQNEQLKLSLKNQSVRENLEKSVDLLKTALKSGNEELKKSSESIERFKKENELLKAQASQMGSQNSLLLSQNAHLTNQIGVKDQELEMLRNMVREMQEAELALKKHHPKPESNESKKGSNLENSFFFISLLNDLYISLAGLMRVAELSAERSRAKELFDKFTELKTETEKLKSPLTDSFKRQLRRDHNAVNEGIKDLKRALTEDYMKRSNLKTRMSFGAGSLNNFVQKEDEIGLGSGPTPFDFDLDQKYKEKFELLEKKFDDLQAEYKKLERNKARIPLMMAQPHEDLVGGGKQSEQIILMTTAGPQPQPQATMYSQAKILRVSPMNPQIQGGLQPILKTHKEVISRKQMFSIPQDMRRSEVMRLSNCQVNRESLKLQNTVVQPSAPKSPSGISSHNKISSSPYRTLKTSGHKIIYGAQPNTPVQRSTSKKVPLVKRASTKQIDGRVARPSHGEWSLSRSSNNQTAKVITHSTPVGNHSIKANSIKEASQASSLILREKCDISNQSRSVASSNHTLGVVRKVERTSTSQSRRIACVKNPREKVVIRSISRPPSDSPARVPRQRVVLKVNSEEHNDKENNSSVSPLSTNPAKVGGELKPRKLVTKEERVRSSEKAPKPQSSNTNLKLNDQVKEMVPEPASPQSNRIFTTNGDPVGEQAQSSQRVQIEKCQDSEVRGEPKERELENETVFNADISSIPPPDKTIKSNNTSQLDMWRKALNHSRDFSPLSKFETLGEQPPLDKSNQRRRKRDSHSRLNDSSQFLVIKSSNESMEVSSKSHAVGKSQRRES